VNVRLQKVGKADGLTGEGAEAINTRRNKPRERVGLNPAGGAEGLRATLRPASESRPLRVAEAIHNPALSNQLLAAA